MADDQSERRSPFVPRARPRLLYRAVPMTGHLEGYERASLVKDGVAGLTVAALAIPSAMGFAEVAGLPPVAGLYALLLPVVAYAFLGTSRQLVVGPEGTSAAVAATAVGPLARDQFDQAGLTTRIGPDRFSSTVRAAVEGPIEPNDDASS